MTMVTTVSAPPAKARPAEKKATRAAKRKATDSARVQASAEARRIRQQVLVTGVGVAPIVTVLQPEEFNRLNIDESYQRLRIGAKVASLTSVLLSGGQIPDPIDVAERPDGSWWIVDGQQRFWACVEAKKPIKVHVHKVNDHESEINLFYALNSRVNLSPRNVLRGWPGPMGVLIRDLNTSDQSPLKGMIDLGNNTKLPLDGSVLAKSIFAVLTGCMPSGDMMTTTMPRADAAMRTPGAHAWAEAYAQLVAAIFGPRGGSGGRRVRALPMLALALVANRKFHEAGRPTFPPSTAKLRAVNWDTAVPSHARQYLPLLQERMEKLWR